MPHDPETIAYWYWKHNYGFDEADQLVEPFLGCHAERTAWFKTARRALFLSTNEVASRLGVSQQTYSRWERNESTGTIKLAVLARVAEAMGCEAVYAIRPKSRRNFSQEVWELVRAPADAKRQRVTPLPGHAWAATARNAFVGRSGRIIRRSYVGGSL